MTIKDIKANQMLNVWASSVIDKNNVDDIFERHYVEDEEEPFSLIEGAVKQTKLKKGDLLVEHYESAKTNESDEEENQDDIKMLKKRHGNFIFRKKI